MTDKTEKHVKRTIDALNALSQKVKVAEAAVKTAPSLRSISSLSDLPKEEAKIVEDRLWEAFSYGEYYVEKVMSDMSDMGHPILPADKSNLSGLLVFYNQKYKPLSQRIRKLVANIEHAQSREEVEDEVLDLEYTEKDETGEWMIFRPYSGGEIDDHMDAYERYVSHDYVRHYAKVQAEVLELTLSLFADNVQPPAESRASSKSQNISLVSASEKKQDVKNVFEQVGEAAENYVDGMSDDPELQKLWVERTDLPRYEKIIDKPYFNPGDWVENQKDLFPIVSRDLKKIPARILLRVHEIYNSYIFGNWLAVIALSRSLLEYAIFDQKSLLKIKNLYDEKGRSRHLWELIADVKGPYMELTACMTCIRKAANVVMHAPSPSDSPYENIVGFPSKKPDAKKCVENILKIISALYGPQPR